MDMMDGLAGTLAGIAEDAPKVAKMGGGVLLGIALGAAVSTLINNGGSFTAPAEAKVPRWVGPVAVTAVGLTLFALKRVDYPALAGANGLGMVAYGVGRLAKDLLNDSAAKDPAGWAAKINSYIPFGATDTYESPILAGLGMGPGSINRYLAQGVNGLGYGAYDRSPGAPTFVEQLNSAPTQFQEVQRLAAAPMTINGLSGLSATLM